MASDRRLRETVGWISLQRTRIPPSARRLLPKRQSTTLLRHGINTTELLTCSPFAMGAGRSR